MTDWYESLFDERYFAFYDGQLSTEPAAQTVAFVDRALSLRPGARILDLGCGFGRHSVPLAKLGYEVTGVDLSGFMLEVARRLADENEVRVDWVRRDMRELSGLGPFDACVCLYTVLGYFDDQQNAGVVRAVRDALVPSGRFLLDLTNPLAMMRGWPAERWRETAGGVTREISTYDPLTARLSAARTIFSREGQVQLPTSVVRMYAPHEIARLLGDAGFEVDQMYGALHDRAFDWSRSEKQVWVATRT